MSRLSEIKLITVSLVALTVFTSCKPEEQDLVVIEDKAIADSVELGISSLAAMGDEQSNEDLGNSLAYNAQAQNNDVISLCSGRAYLATCNSGIKNQNYSDCIISGTDQILSGYVSLEYSNADCSFNETGDTINRVFDTTRKTSWGAEIKTSSLNKTDFEGNTYGGGGVLTKIDDGYEIEVLGKHRLRTSASGRSRIDISMKTSAPIFMSKLSRSNRVIDGGALEIVHNLARYKVILEPNALEYSASCCYPIAGTINVSYSGAINGSGAVTFNGCAEATLTRGNESHRIELYSCE